MQFDRRITITTGTNRWAKVWNAQQMLWSELCERLRTPARGAETLSQYLAMPKSQQDELKDVGGFVGGAFAGTRRKADQVAGRDLITLDLDNIPAEQTQTVLQRIAALGCGYCVYSTRKHSAAKPRIRVICPLDRTCTADEYEPIARKLAELIGMELCDPTTFQASRLMYFPSCCSDSEYVFGYEDKPMLSADGVLAMYGDWHDVSQWAEVPNAPQMRKRLAAKQGDPTEKKGIVGAFCRAYDVPAAIAAFLPEIYTEAAGGDRYTYAAGSTTGGAVLYDDGKFLYSNHATDPAGGRLCNAFDLVRLHKYAALDEEAKDGTPTNKLPSYHKMCELAAADSSVTALLHQERYERAAAEFARAPQSVPAADDLRWLEKLEVHHETGKPLKTVDNVLLILEHDPHLKGRMSFDEFSNRALLHCPVPWDAAQERRDWKDSDDAGLRHYLEHTYGITGRDRITDAHALCCQRHRFNAVRQYLENLPPWDGTARLDKLFIDYLGAEDSVYVRAVTRKGFVAAVARAMMPGVKYDTMPILAGPQGLGKSTLLRMMGRSWFNDSMNSFDGKEACEMIQGSWIIEIGELNSMSRSDENQVKQFLSKTEDIYREPYGRRTGRYPRRCVMFGTTNEGEFLRDPTGGRRFWPVDCSAQTPTRSVFTELEAEVPQLWAEALTLWRVGEKLYLDGEAAEAAKRQQEAHKETSSKEGVIREFVSRKVPADWSKRSLSQRRNFWADEFKRSEDGLMERDRVCALEIWCECLGGDIKYMKKSDAKEINGILAGLEGWKKSDKTMRCGAEYGIQRCYIRM